MQNGEDEKYDYVATYKCLLCGEVYVGHNEFDDPYSLRSDLMNNLSNKMVTDPDVRTPMFDAHVCANGNVGLLQFIGYVKCKN